MMLVSVDAARANSESLSQLADSLGLVPYETPTSEIIGKLLDHVEQEVEVNFMELPTDADYTPIRPRVFTKEYGYVHGVGLDCIFAGDEITDGGYTGYAVFSANSCHVRRDDGESLVELVRDAVANDKLAPRNIRLIKSYIEGFLGGSNAVG